MPLRQDPVDSPDLPGDALVLITGAAGGLGRELTMRYLADGFRVHACDVDRNALDRVAGEHDSRRLRITCVDVGDAAALARLFRDLSAWQSDVSVLINNIGISGARGDIESLSRDDWSRSLSVNLLGAVECARHVIPGMKRQRCGAIVSISTSSVVTRPVSRTPYIASKAALEAFTLAAARELGQYGIRSNVVRPGLMDNPRMHRVLGDVARSEGISPDEALARELAHVSMRTMVSMNDVASMVMYLTSGAARHVTGQVFAVDAGHEWEF
ncbi:MAG TPA: SDR family oxidoreductase [Steroidobacteraceae bacterium]|nr:SDR family oxidoreductase [Steroidobacteraceae bacterium]